MREANPSGDINHPKSKSELFTCLIQILYDGN